MKTYVPKKDEVERKWWLVDADGKILGRLATEVANLLRGKVKPQYVDFLDIDRPLYPDHTTMKELVKSCEILEEVEKLIGSLE